jgi:hypothetical protein
MRSRWASLLAAATTLVVLAGPAAATAAPTPAADAYRHTLRKAPHDVPRVSVDTDLALWWDDVTALAIVNAAEDQGQVKYLGTVSDVKSLDAVPAIDAIDTWYGNGDVPVGATLGTDWDLFPNAYSSELARRFKHSPGDGSRAPEAVALYRRLLAQQPDHSVTIVSIGGHTNLAGLLASRGGKALVERKVKGLVVMAGEFPTASRAWTNELIDVPATRYVFNTAWPTSVPIVWADAKIGFPLFVGQTVTQAHSGGPVRAAFELLFPDGKVGDANWDAIALYYAIYGLGDDILSLTGEGGAARVSGVGAISWVPNPNRPDDRYIQVTSYPALAGAINALIDYVPRNQRPR